MMTFVKRNKLLIFTAFVYLLVLLFKTDLFLRAIDLTKGFLLEMLEIMPAVLVISALITVWIPASVIAKHFGNSSGLRGKFISILIGAFSAGPIYAAFPMAKSLLEKGASVGNVVVIISSWAVIKVPMFMVEMKFLGLPFALARYGLTIPAILFLGVLMEKLVKNNELKAEVTTVRENSIEVIERLPRLDCGACGHGSCKSMAEAIAKGEAKLTDCPILDT